MTDAIAKPYFSKGLVMAKPRTRPVAGTPVLEVVGQLFDESDPFLLISQHVAQRFADEDFGDLYGVRGPIPDSPKVLALASLLQFITKVPDRQAARYARMDLGWKLALGLPIEHAGFHFSLLSEFRERLLCSEKHRLIFDECLLMLVELGLVRKGGKQRLDATHVLGAVRELSRLELVCESLRKTVEDLVRLLGHDAATKLVGDEAMDFTARKWILSKMGKDKKRRTMHQAGVHAVAVLTRVAAHPREDVRALESIKILREIVEQNFSVNENREVAEKTTKEWQQTPGPDRVSTPHDPEARYGEKRKKGWVGYKAEIVETAEPDRPNFVTAVDVHNAAKPDRSALQPMVEDLKQKDLLPEQLYVDAGYTSGEAIDTLQEDHDVALRGPVAEEPKRGVFPQSEFTIDRENEQATCPQGHISASCSHEKSGEIQFTFSKADCASCPLRSKCTKGKGPRHLTVNKHSDTLRTRRDEQKQEVFKKEMHARAAIEGTISEGKRGHGLNRARYRGEVKMRLQALITGAAMNVKRFIRAVAAGLVPAPEPAKAQ